jgi:drug/metabolite transporter (DMT)-like permease
MPIKTPHHQPADNLPLAVTAIVLTVLALSLGDALIKFTSGDFVIWQIFVLRSLLALPVLLIFLKIKAPEALSIPPALGWTCLRSFMLVSSWITYYLALPNLDLSIAAAALYTLPIFITLFSAIFIGDKIKVLGWVAVIIGFVGVLLILRPKAGDFNLYALLPLVSAVLYALSMILTRTKCQRVNPFMLSVVLNLTFIAVGLVAAIATILFASEPREGFLLAHWAVMGGAEWISMALLATAIMIGSIGTAIAYQKGPPAIIGIFDFAYVGFALFWGLVFFSEVPDMISMIGIFLIISAGIMSLRKRG